MKPSPRLGAKHCCVSCMDACRWDTSIRICPANFKTMAHTCPRCDQLCHCNGDIDDHESGLSGICTKDHDGCTRDDFDCDDDDWDDDEPLL